MHVSSVWTEYTLSWSIPVLIVLSTMVTTDQGIPIKCYTLCFFFVLYSIILMSWKEQCHKYQNSIQTRTLIKHCKNKFLFCLGHYNPHPPKKSHTKIFGLFRKCFGIIKLFTLSQWQSEIRVDIYRWVILILILEVTQNILRTHKERLVFSEKKKSDL